MPAYLVPTVKDKNGNVLAVMANPLLRRKLTLDVMQQHILHLAIGQIDDPRVEREKLPLFHISVAAYAAATGRSDRSGSVYEQLAKAVRGLQHAEVLIPGGQKIAILAPYAEYVKDESRIEVEFNERLKPYLLGIKEYFAGVPVKEACQLRSGYAISFYLYCVSWNKSNQRGWSMTEQEMRDWLSIPPGTLERTCDLKKRVIDQAQRELDSKASLTFRARALREGRKTSGWFFEIKDNKPRRSSKRQANGGIARRTLGQTDEPAINAVVLEDFDRLERLWFSADPDQQSRWVASLRPEEQMFVPKPGERPRKCFLSILGAAIESERIEVLETAAA
jgi:hypothetical protein